MAKWAGEGKHWEQEMMMHLPRKDQVINSLMKITGLPSKHLMKKAAGVPSIKNKAIGSHGF